jgi:hypothetical protein
MKLPNGEQFSVQLFYVAKVGRGTIERLVLGPFIDWGQANAARQYQGPDSHTILSTTQVMEVDDDRKLSRDSSC